MIDINEFVKDCSKEFESIDKKYVWEKARFDRKLLFVVGVLTILISIINIIDIAYGAIKNREIMEFYLFSALSFALFMIFIGFVQLIDKRNGQEEIQRKCGKELRSAFTRNLKKHGIETEFQKMIVLSEIRNIKSRSLLSDRQKRIIDLMGTSLLIPPALMILQRIIDEESILKQIHVFVFFAAVVTMSLLFVDMVMEILRTIRKKWRRYERVEHYLMESFFEDNFEPIKEDG